MNQYESVLVKLLPQVTELAGQTEKHFDQLEHTVDHKDKSWASEDGRSR